MDEQLVRYDEGLTDSRRWDGFELRPGDIVISTPSKCGTTWLQMICALLVFQTPHLPDPLTRLSPWLDMRLRPREEVHELLRRQQHRRVIKTHTPLDGLPWSPEVTYVVAGRDPRDVAVSMEHHRSNLDGQVIEQALAAVATGDDTAPQPPRARPATRRERLLEWVEGGGLQGLVWHLQTAWERSGHDNLVLMHYTDMSEDPPGRMKELADRLQINVPAAAWPDLVEAASFAGMRRQARRVVPDEQMGLFRDHQRFFRSGTVGQWRENFDEELHHRYESALHRLVPDPPMAHWLHHGTGGEVDRAGP